MKKGRRNFLKFTGLASLSIGSGISNALASELPMSNSKTVAGASEPIFDEKHLSMIGLYGEWASSLTEKKLPSLSYRRKEFSSLDAWRKVARTRVTERMGIPAIGGTLKAKINKQYEYDGLHIEELTWQLPYGRPTEAILLKPLRQTKPLPGILALHDHAGNKYFGTSKITRTSDNQHPLMKTHQQQYYEGLAWANEIAKRGFVVLVPDAFTFASRRVMLQDVHPDIREGLNDDDPENPVNIEAYNKWAGQHEHIMAKSLFCAGTTWPGVFFAEDQKALDVLCARKDVDASRIGCGGLSGGGLRSVMMGGLDSRIKCAVSVGFMSTWKDFLMNKSFTHTWMLYVPILPKELDFPEILGLRVPLPTLVLNDTDDSLYTVPGMIEADKILGEVYKKAGAVDRYKCSFYPGPHEFDAKMQSEAFEWIERWLKVR